MPTTPVVVAGWEEWFEEEAMTCGVAIAEWRGIEREREGLRRQGELRKRGRESAQ